MTYTFNTNWLQEFESSWCVHEKFKFANALNGTEYLNLLGATHVIGKNTIAANSISKNLNALNKLENLTNANIYPDKVVDIKQILGAVYHQQNYMRYFASYLRYCPECLSQGYHSIYHQLIWVDTCPIHGCKLQDRTINNDHIPISLNQRKYHKGFELNIGTSVIAKGIRETYEMWSIPLDITALKNTLPTVSSPNICCLHYLPFSFRQHDYSLEYFIERGTHFNTIINLQYNELIHKATVLPLSLDIDISKSFHLCPGDSFKKFYFGIYHAIVNQYPILNLATLSNYAKYMKSSHISLIKLAQKGILNPDVCTCILWNRDVLGYDDYLHVTSRLEQFEGSINNSVFYKYLLYEWAMYKVTKSKIPLNVFLSLLQTILIKILVAQYKTYYQLSPSLINISNKKQITLSVKTLAPMPLIISYYHSQTKAYYILDCDYL